MCPLRALILGVEERKRGAIHQEIPLQNFLPSACLKELVVKFSKARDVCQKQGLCCKPEAKLPLTLRAFPAHYVLTTQG